MKKVMKRVLCVALAIAMLCCLAACGEKKEEASAGDTQGNAGDAAQTEELSYPFKSVTMIVPYGAGGTTDLVGRQLANALGKVLNVSFVVDNQAGASGSIGCQAALDAKQDGSTVLFTAESLGTQRVMGISDLSYADYAPIMLTANDPKVIVVNKGSEYDTIDKLLAAIKENPGKIQMAYTGPGGSGHVQALIMNKYGYEPALTAYKSGSDGIVAVMGDQVVFTNSNYSSVASYIESGDLLLLAVCATERMEKYPDVPALTEYMEGSEELLSIPYTPLSLVVGKDVPADVQETLRKACAEAVKDPDFVNFMDTYCVDKLYEKYPTLDDMNKFYSDWESTVSWLLYDAGAATNSPEDFNIPRK